jgi:hypothetical protein
VTPPEPTEQDRENARRRREIAERQAEEYADAERIAREALGPGWSPWMKLSLIDSDHHRTGNTKPVATVFKVYRGEARLTENSVYLRLMPDGQVQQAPSYEPLFGELLQASHPTRTLEIRGQQVPCPRYSLCWSALERYEPLPAEKLAVLRTTRERKKAERAERRWAEAYPLLALAEKQQDTTPESEGPAR